MDTTSITTQMRCNDFLPNRLVTLLGRPYATLEDVRDAYTHTINVLQRKIYGRYGQKIKHMAVAETGHKHFDYGKGAHIHALIYCDKDWLEMDKWKTAIKTTWIGTDTGTGISLVDDMKIAEEKWFKEVYDLAGAVRYCFKNSNDADKYEYVGMRY